MHFHSKSRQHAQLRRREIWKVLKEVFWKVLKGGNSFGVIKLLRARCFSLWGFPFYSVRDLSKVRFQINGIFLFPDELYFSELCFASLESIYLTDPDWFQSQAAVGLPQILWKQAKNIFTPENATNFSHTQRLMCKELIFLNTSHQWWL